MLARFIRKQNTPPTQDAVREALRTLIDPATGTVLDDEALVERITVDHRGVVVVLSIDAASHHARAPLVSKGANALQQRLGCDVKILLTAHKTAPHADHAASQQAPRKKASWNLTPIPHVQSIVAVASGKGGVGKSTTTVMLAHALRARGLRVGIVDADIYGPSIPRMLGLESTRQPEIQDNQMIPPVAHGIAAMSMGLIMGDTAAVMRAPMITKALHQLLRGTRWGSEEAPLDVLLVDMPPGTGDIHISLAQAVPLAGAIIVTTPQDVAVMDAKKCLLAFEKLGVPVLGIIENMSGFTDASGYHHAIFGEGGGKKLAAEHGSKLLASIPLNPALCQAMERGLCDDSLLAHYHGISETLS